MTHWTLWQWRTQDLRVEPITPPDPAPTLLPTSSTLQAYLAKSFRSPAPATACDILYWVYSTSNSSSNANVLLDWDLNNTWYQTSRFDICTAHMIQEHNHHGISTYSCGMICKKGHLYTTCRCLNFLKEQTSSNIKLQDHIPPTTHVIIEEHYRWHLNSFW